MMIVKYNTMFYRKLQFAESYFPTDAKQVDHYAEGLLIEYWATIRYHNTLESSMDESLGVEVDLATLGHSIAKVGEKSKWEGSCESSRKKKKGHQPISQIYAKSVTLYKMDHVVIVL